MPVTDVRTGSAPAVEGVALGSPRRCRASLEQDPSARVAARVGELPTTHVARPRGREHLRALAADPQHARDRVVARSANPSEKPQPAISRTPSRTTPARRTSRRSVSVTVCPVRIVRSPTAIRVVR